MPLFSPLGQVSGRTLENGETDSTVFKKLIRLLFFYFYLFDFSGSLLRHAGSLVIACKPLVVACGIQFPDQG